MNSFQLLLSVTIICLLRLGQVENKAFFGIGRRVNGDQLLLKDLQESRPGSFDEPPRVHFKYFIPHSIDYIEIISEKNVFAAVNFSYENDLVAGTVSALNGTAEVQKPFEVIISIYGFKEPMMNVHRSLILNRDQHFRGTLKPFSHNAAESLLHENSEPLETFDEENPAEQIPNIALEEDGGVEQQDIEADFEHRDGIIVVCNRQNGDYLIYETTQTSPEATEHATNHSVVFYYFDRNYITCVTFTLFDYFNDNPPDNAQAPIVQYSFLSPTTLKAVITDPQTTSLFVKMRIYGYNHDDLPTNYVAFPSNTPHGESTDSMLFPLHHLQKLLQASAAPPADKPDLSNLLPLNVEQDAQGKVQLVNVDKSVVCQTSGGTRGVSLPLAKLLIAPLLAAFCARPRLT